MNDPARKNREDVAEKLNRRRIRLAEEYGIMSDEEILDEYDKLERIDITLFVTPIEKWMSDEPVKQVLWPSNHKYYRNKR